MPLGPAQAVADCGSLCSSCQMGPGRAQAAPALSLYWRPSQEAPESTHSGLPQTTTAYHLLDPQTAYPEGSFRSHQNMLGQILLRGVSPLCSCGQFSQQASLRVNLTHGQANSNQGSTMTEGHTQSIQGALLDTRLG